MIRRVMICRASDRVMIGASNRGTSRGTSCGAGDPRMIRLSDRGSCHSEGETPFDG